MTKSIPKGLLKKRLLLQKTLAKLRKINVK